LNATNLGEHRVRRDPRIESVDVLHHCQQHDRNTAVGVLGHLAECGEPLDPYEASEREEYSAG